VRGEGFLLGLKCRPPVGDVVAAARKARVLTVGAGDNVMRLLPPLTLTDAEMDEGLARLEAAAKTMEATLAAQTVKGAAA
jgi:acetylornithine/N-succinyldiaminopimelate aminotransferase